MNVCLVPKLQMPHEQETSAAETILYEGMYSLLCIFPQIYIFSPSLVSTEPQSVNLIAD